MPLYEYRCPSCEREIELQVKVGSPNPVCVCKDGDPPVMEKLLSLGSFQLKGAGWYRDGYSKK